MRRQLLVSVFQREEDVLGATAAARKHGLNIVDVFSPYTVHGLDRALDLPPSRLSWVCFLLGLSGAAAILEVARVSGDRTEARQARRSGPIAMRHSALPRTRRALAVLRSRADWQHTGRTISCPTSTRGKPHCCSPERPDA